MEFIYCRSNLVRSDSLTISGIFFPGMDLFLPTTIRKIVAQMFLFFFFKNFYAILIFSLQNKQILLSLENKEIFENYFLCIGIHIPHDFFFFKNFQNTTILPYFLK